MASFYLTRKAFDSIRPDTIEYKILGKQNQIFLDMSQDELYDENDNDEVTDYGLSSLCDFQLEFANVSFESGREIHDAALKGCYTKLLEIPDGIFVLNTSKEKASEISKKYGILCLSDQEFDFDMLTRSHSKFMERQISVDESAVEINKPINDNPIQLSNIFPDEVMLPCNTAIIIDKYLLNKDDKTGKITSRILEKIFKTGLLSDTGQLLFIVEVSNTPNRKEDFKAIAENVYREFTNIHNSKFFVAFLGVNSIEKIFGDLHNRCIITNYAVISAEHSLALVNERGYSKYDQYFTIRNLYSEGITNRSDTPEKARRMILRKVQGHVDIAIRHFDKNNEAPNFLYAHERDGSLVSKPRKVSPSDLKNRFIKIS